MQLRTMNIRMFIFLSYIIIAENFIDNEKTAHLGQANSCPHYIAMHNWITILIVYIGLQ